jgi:cell division protease FtsH
MSFGKKDEQIFLGREIAQHRDYSESTAIAIDGEVRQIVESGYALAKKLVDENREAVVRIAEALLEREILDGNEVRMLIAGETLPAARNNNKPNGDGQTQQVLRPDTSIRPNPSMNPGERPSPA